MHMIRTSRLGKIKVRTGPVHFGKVREVDDIDNDHRPVEEMLAARALLLLSVLTPAMSLTASGRYFSFRNKVCSCRDTQFVL